MEIELIVERGGLTLFKWNAEDSEALRVGLRAMCKHLETGQYRDSAREIWEYLNEVDAKS